MTKIQMVLDLEYHLSFDYIYMHICGGDKLYNRSFSQLSDLRRVIQHTVMYYSSTSTYKPNFVQIDHMVVHAAGLTK